MSNVLVNISLHADTQHRAVDLSSYQFIQEIINTSKLTIFEAVFRWNTWKIVDYYPQSDASGNRATGFAISGSVFDPLPAVICFW